MLQARESAAGKHPSGPGASVLVGLVGHLSCRCLEGDSRARMFQNIPECSGMFHNALGIVAFWLQADIQDCAHHLQAVLLGVKGAFVLANSRETG